MVGAIAGSVTQKSWLTSSFEYDVFSFYFRLHAGSSKQPTDLTHIKSQICECIEQSSLDEDQRKQAMSKAMNLVEQIQLHSGAKSVSIFVSLDEGELHHHFVFLPERCYVGKEFALQEFLWAEYVSQDYLLILAGPSSLSVFDGRGSDLRKSDKSADHLLSAFKHWHNKRDAKFESANEAESLLQSLTQLVDEKGVPLLLIGSEYLPDLNQAVLKGLKVKGVFPGNKVDTTAANLHIALEHFLDQCFESDTDMLLKKCEQSGRQHRLATGEQDMHDCAKEGKGELLVLVPPTRESRFRKLDVDCTQRTVRHTLLNHGRVMFAKKGPPALILRY